MMFNTRHNKRGINVYGIDKLKNVIFLVKI